VVAGGNPSKPVSVFFRKIAEIVQSIVSRLKLRTQDVIAVKSVRSSSLTMKVKKYMFISGSIRQEWDTSQSSANLHKEKRFWWPKCDGIIVGFDVKEM
jgi:hypothetical protein